MSLITIVKASFSDSPNNADCVPTQTLRSILEALYQSPDCHSVYCGNINNDEHAVVLLAVWNDSTIITPPHLPLDGLVDFLVSPPTIWQCRFQPSIVKLIKSRKHQLDLDMFFIHHADHTTAKSAAPDIDAMEKKTSLLSQAVSCHRGEILKSHRPTSTQVFLIEYYGRRPGPTFQEHLTPGLESLKSQGHEIETLKVYLLRERQNKGYLRTPDRLAFDSEDSEDEEMEAETESNLEEMAKKREQQQQQQQHPLRVISQIEKPLCTLGEQRVHVIPGLEEEIARWTARREKQ